MGKADALRKLIREEVKKALREEMPSLLKEVSSKTTLKESVRTEAGVPLTLNKQTPKAPTFSKTNPLANLLNETAANMASNSEEWSTISMDSGDVSASEFLARDTARVGGVQDMLSHSKNSAALEMVEVSTVPDFNNLMDNLISKGHL